MCLIDTVLDISYQIFKNVSESFQNAIEAGKKYDPKIDEVGTKLVKRTEFSKLKGDLAHIGIISDLMNS